MNIYNYKDEYDIILERKKRRKIILISMITVLFIIFVSLTIYSVKLSKPAKEYHQDDVYDYEGDQETFFPEIEED